MGRADLHGFYGDDQISVHMNGAFCLYMGIVLNGNRNLGVAGPLAGDTTVYNDRHLMLLYRPLQRHIHIGNGIQKRLQLRLAVDLQSQLGLIQCELPGYGLDDGIADLDLIEHKAADISGVTGLFPVIADLHSDSSGNPLDGMNQLTIDIHFAVCTTGVIPLKFMPALRAFYIGCREVAICTENILIRTDAYIDTDRAPGTFLRNHIGNAYGIGLLIHGIIHPNGEHLLLRCTESKSDHLCGLINYIAVSAGMCLLVSAGRRAGLFQPSCKAAVAEAVIQGNCIRGRGLKGEYGAYCAGAAQPTLKGSDPPVVGGLLFQTCGCKGGIPYRGIHNYLGKLLILGDLQQVAVGTLNRIPCKSCSGGNLHILCVVRRSGQDRCLHLHAQIGAVFIPVHTGLAALEVFVTLNFLNFGASLDLEVLTGSVYEADIRTGAIALVVIYLTVGSNFTYKGIGSAAHCDVIFDHRILGDAALAALLSALAALFRCTHIRIEHSGVLLFPLGKACFIAELTQLVHHCLPCLVVTAIRDVGRLMCPAHAAVVIADEAAAVIDLNIIGDHIVPAAAYQERICLHIHKQVIGGNGAGGHIIKIDTVGTAVGGIGDIIEIVIGNDISSACPVTGAGVDRAGVTCLVEDMGNLVARNLMVIAGEGNSLMRGIGDLVSGHQIAAAEDAHCWSIGTLDYRIIVKEAVIHHVIAGGQRENLAAVQQDTAGAHVLKVTALNGIIMVFKAAVHGNALLTHIGKQAVGDQNMMAVVQVNGICVAGGEVQTLNGDVRGICQLEEGIRQHA